MPADDALVVPVEVAALAVNRSVRDAGGDFVIQRWSANFRQTELRNVSPEPPPFSTNETWTDNPDVLGVYLQWQLPEGLATGRHDEQEGIGDFPLVPNRWLVVRHTGVAADAAAWVVHSDYLDPNQGTVSYLDPVSDHLKSTKIGRRHLLTPAAPWTEPSSKPAPFLTAVGPGLPAFAVFQPYNENVFSLHDRLERPAVLDDEGNPVTIGDTATISYLVAGWYAEAGSDILAGPGDLKDFDELLRRLKWSRPSGSGVLSRSVYTGTALGIGWNLGGVAPESECPGPDEVTVSIGNSTAEAITALTDQADGPGSLSADEARVFRAFTFGALDALNRADGDELIERNAHQQGFIPSPGGYTWRMVDRTEAGEPPPGSPAWQAAETDREDALVAGLNGAQRDHDASERNLAAARERLYHLWWLSQQSKTPEGFDGAVAGELDPGGTPGDPDYPASPDTAAGQAAVLDSKVTGLRAQIPWGTTPEELAVSAAEHVQQAGLRSTLWLSRVPADPYEQHADPVVALHGAKLSAPLTRSDDLPCRVQAEFVTAAGDGSRQVTAAMVAADAARTNLASLPGAMPGALTEFLILDRTVRSGIALEQAAGVLPEYGTGAWRQPWQPLYLQWQAEYFALPFEESGGARNWEFAYNNARTRYHYRYLGTADVDLDHPLTASGRQYLAPSAGHDQAGRIAEFTQHRGGLPAEVISSLREEARWEDILSQRLDGLSATVGQRSALPNVAASNGALAGLIGDGDLLAPDPGEQPEDAWDEWPPSRFQELRSGQLAFTRLSVIDRFGRAVNLINNPQHFNPVIPPDMVPGHPVGVDEPDRVIELAPRLLQPARLRFAFLSASADEDVEVTPGTSPVCAWLLHNRLDASLACYGADGTALGELRTIVGASGTPEVEWTPLPGSPVAVLSELEPVSLHAYRLLKAISDKGPQTFEAVRKTMDDALCDIEADGPGSDGLSFLLGRPLALLRARLDLELAGPAHTDVSWQNVLSPPDPRMPGYEWIVRLGEPEQPDDGLVGYVLDDDYEHLETVTEPVGPDTDYLRLIGNGSRLKLAFSGDSQAIVTLLADPYAPVHAVTDILPTMTLTIPEQFVTEPIARMAVCFRAGPLLAQTRELPGEDGKPVELAVMPQPATAVGAWSWTEPAGPGWRDLPIVPGDPSGIPAGESQLRSGFLVLHDGASNARRNHTSGRA